MSYCAHCGAELQEAAAFCSRCGKPPAGPVVSTKKHSLMPLYIVLGCFGGIMVLALVGIFAAILIPNFLDALQKAKEKRAVADLQRMGEAIELYQAEHGAPPMVKDMAGLAAALPTGKANVIAPLDPWHHPYQYTCWHETGAASSGGSDDQACNHYRIASAGRDGKFDMSLMDYGNSEFSPTDYDRDIVFGDGKFIAFPSGPLSHR